MNKNLILLAAVLFSNTTFAQVGINTATPEASLDVQSLGNTSATKAMKINNSSNTEMVTVMDNGNMGIGTSTPESKLDVNGDLRIRSVGTLTDPATYALSVDSNGLVGRANITSQLAYFSTTGTVFAAPAGSANLTSVNNGDVITIPIEVSHGIINTMGATIGTNNTINITEMGYYQISAALNFALSMSVSQRFFVAVNVQRSTDNGNTWTSLTGIRPIIQSAATTATAININYPQVIAPVIAQLNSGDLLRLVFFRTRDNSGNLQGDAVTVLNVTSHIGFGILPYNLSISKL